MRLGSQDSQAKDTEVVVIRIGTRGSKLALWQANWVKSQLAAAGHDVELVIIRRVVMFQQSR